MIRATGLTGDTGLLTIGLPDTGPLRYRPIGPTGDTGPGPIGLTGHWALLPIGLTVIRPHRLLDTGAYRSIGLTVTLIYW
ncbi:hypothetical protein [Lacrimispora indolis]|uniref:hypothetical protein n=1 Tax=Lacrimispora indolis TaxID=69825 RepID=UPI0012EC084E|nr:hypothetical protein [[Clostridium] methoxybenzovorans]